MAGKDFGDEMALLWLGEVFKKRNTLGRWNTKYKSKCVPGLFQKQFNT